VLAVVSGVNGVPHFAQRSGVVVMASFFLSKAFEKSLAPYWRAFLSESFYSQSFYSEGF